MLVAGPFVFGASKISPATQYVPASVDRDGGEPKLLAIGAIAVRNSEEAVRVGWKDLLLRK